MTDLQQVEFKILQAVDAVCRQLHINYYLICGSALGAVKYSGFIPWDDDLDIGLLRPDYEIFVEKAQELLPNSYFLQNYRTDPAFPQIFSKVRDSNTTYIEKSAAKLSINHGVYIDVFPLDGYPKTPFEIRRLELLKKKYKLMAACAFQLPCSWCTKLFFGLERLLGIHKHLQHNRLCRSSHCISGAVQVAGRSPSAYFACKGARPSAPERELYSLRPYGVRL